MSASQNCLYNMPSNQDAIPTTLLTISECCSTNGLHSVDTIIVGSHVPHLGPIQHMNSSALHANGVDELPILFENPDSRNMENWFPGED